MASHVRIFLQPLCLFFLLVPFFSVSFIHRGILTSIGVLPDSELNIGPCYQSSLSNVCR